MALKLGRFRPSIDAYSYENRSEYPHKLRTFLSLTACMAVSSFVFTQLSQKARQKNRIKRTVKTDLSIQESPANAKGTRDSSACMKAHC